MSSQLPPPSTSTSTPPSSTPPSSTPTRPTGGAAAAPSVELGLALRGLTSDPDWLKRYGLVGLFMLIPIVGPISMLGWCRRIYEAAREGEVDALPEPDLMGDVSHGVAPFVAMLNLMLPAMVLAMGVWVVAMVVAVGAGVAGEQGSDALAGLSIVMMLGMYALMFVGILAINLLMPEVQRRGYNGEHGPLLSPGRSLRAIARAPGAYLMVLLGLFVANALSSVGVFACYLGLFLTVPMALAVVARLLAQWDAVVAHHEREAGA